MSNFVNYLRNEVISVADRLGILYVELTIEERKELFRRLLKMHFSIPGYDFPLYNFLIEDFSIQDKNAWRWVEDYIQHNKVVLFFEQNDDQNFIEFLNGKDLVDVISESFLFTFYLTNREGDYLFVFNRYDFLIGSGNAKEWLIEFSSKAM